MAHFARNERFGNHPDDPAIGGQHGVSDAHPSKTDASSAIDEFQAAPRHGTVPITRSLEVGGMGTRCWSRNRHKPV